MNFFKIIVRKFIIFLLNKSDKILKSKSLPYTLFDYFYLKKIKNVSDNIFYNLFKFGYLKIEKNYSNFVDKINNHLTKLKFKKKTDYMMLYEIDDYIESEVNNFCNNDLKEVIDELSKAYMSNIYLAQIKIGENFHFEENTQKYSNFFHVDNNRFTLFKIFISLENISSNQGPTHIIPCNKTYEFIKKTKYKNRYNYDHKTSDFDIYENTSLKGDALICNTSRCYHKAGVPKQNFSRKMMTLSFVAYPKNYEMNKHLDFFKDPKLSKIYEKNFINYLSKSTDFFDNYKLYKNYMEFMKKNF